MLKRNTKTDSENDKNYLTVEEFNAIRRMDFPKDFLDFLEIGFRTGLRAADILNLKKENIVLTKNDDDSLTGRIHGTALKTKSQTQINIRLDQKLLSILKDRLENTNRAGNLKFLESHNVKYFEIKFRQRMNTHDPVHFYMEDQSASINAINKYLK